MNIGTVKFFNDAKGYGTITEEGSNKDHSVHKSGLVDDIKAGDSVSFKLAEGKKGLIAVDVKVRG